MNKSVNLFVLFSACVGCVWSDSYGCEYLPIPFIYPSRAAGNPIYVAKGYTFASFSDAGSYDPDGGDIIDWFWGLNSNQSGFDQHMSSAECTFNTIGKQEVRLLVMDDQYQWSDGWNGQESTYPTGYAPCWVSVFDVEITTPSSDPILMVCDGQPMQLDSTVHGDAPDGQYHWSASPSTGCSFSDADAEDPTFTITTPGSYVVTVTYTMDNGDIRDAMAVDSI